MVSIGDCRPCRSQLQGKDLQGKDLQVPGGLADPDREEHHLR